MDAFTYLNKYIIGQERLKPELSVFMDELKSGRNLNLMIRGASGYGKTYLAKVIVNYVDVKQSIKYLGEAALDLDKSFRIHILDEVHEIKSPEYLYPIMDSGLFTFILATNEFADIKEPFQNRCISIMLLPYSEEEIAIIVNKVFNKFRYSLPFEYCLKVSSFSRGNPRIAEQNTKRLSMLFRRVGVPGTLDELDEQIQIYFNISRGGFTDLDKVYLNFLKYNGTCGIDTISRILALPKLTIQSEIEPFLIRKGLIRITSRGRQLIGD